MKRLVFYLLLLFQFHLMPAQIADAVVWTDNLMTPKTKIRLTHIAELQQAANEKFSLQGRPLKVWTPILSTSKISATYITELRTAVVELYTNAGLPVPTFSDDPIVPGTTIVRATHIIELRNAIDALNAPPQNGVCGPANGTPVPSAPTANLCSSGTPTPVTKPNPWRWRCLGSNGGTTANCSAPKIFGRWVAFGKPSLARLNTCPIGFPPCTIGSTCWWRVGKNQSQKYVCR